LPIVRVYLERMKIFLDTANLSEIREAAQTGLIDGVTTNPSLVAKEGKSFKEILKEITQLVKGPISAEVVATDYDGMIREAKPLADLHSNIVIKVPLTVDGLRACQTLSRSGTKVNVTLCFSLTQALLAAKSGATYISPFIGRLDDISENGMKLIKDIVKIYKNYEFKTEVLAASIRHPMHVVEAALVAPHVGTMPYTVFQQLFKHPLTDRGLEKFLADWKKATA
jgi:transaldolase